MVAAKRSPGGDMLANASGLHQQAAVIRNRRGEFPPAARPGPEAGLMGAAMHAEKGQIIVKPRHDIPRSTVLRQIDPGRRETMRPLFE